MTEGDVPSRFAVDFAGATLLGIYRVERKIADRSVRMNVETRTDITFTVGDDEKAVSVVQTVHYESERE